MAIFKRPTIKNSTFSCFKWGPTQTAPTPAHPPAQFPSTLFSYCLASLYFSNFKILLQPAKKATLLQLPSFVCTAFCKRFFSFNFLIGISCQLLNRVLLHLPSIWSYYFIKTYPLSKYLVIWVLNCKYFKNFWWSFQKIEECRFW